MKQITAAQHAAIVFKSHAENHEPRYREYRTFAKPGETQADAIKRYMAARKRYHRTPVARQFPCTTAELEAIKSELQAKIQAFYEKEEQLQDMTEQ